jgi:hypothetical protein
VPTRSESEEKLHDLHGLIAYGCAGSVGLQQRVKAALDENISAADCGLPIEELRPELLSVVNAVQREALSEFIDLGENTLPAHLEALFCGVTEDEPWIYEINVAGADQLHPEGEAIGHATHFPYYLMVSTIHYRLAERGVHQVKLLAYRSVNDAIMTDARLGPPIKLLLVTTDGVRRLDDSALNAVRDSINGWKEQEHKIFRGLEGEAPPQAGAGTEEGLEPESGD